MADEDREVLFFTVAAMSRALREGHPCVFVSELANRALAPHEPEAEAEAAADFTFPSQSDLVRILSDAPAVTTRSMTSDPETLRTPLVFDGEDRLYVARFFEHERRLSSALADLLSQNDEVRDVDGIGWLEARLDHYFPRQPATEVDHQRKAAECALVERLCVVSGGPGTGKTSTVVKILAIASEWALHQGKAPPRILLAAPTGKAAARLNESIEAALSRLALAPRVVEAIRPRAITIHRALGVRADSQTRYVRHRDYPFSADIVLIDEASMVDLAMMRHVCDALPASARLIVLGDRHQLASVEAGSVFSELCSALSGHQTKNLIELKRSYRFSEQSGIFAMSGAIRDGDARAVARISQENRRDVHAHPSIAESLSLERLCRLSEQLWERAFRAPNAREALARFSDFRILAAHRKGPFGVEELNRVVAHYLMERGKLPSALHLSRGQLLMILENDRALGVNNGDVAVVWPDENGRLMACLPGEGNDLRHVSPAQLPPYELCFAMTIHKSQGSEYERVAVVLPKVGSPLLSRELLYTAVTRARSEVDIFSDQESLQVAVETAVLRRSGLASTLRSRVGRFNPPL